MTLEDRLELAAQACRAAHLLSCETTCREATTALSLAQTEIKGHMRVVDELKAEIAKLRGMVDECHGWLEDTRRKNAEAQSRIAELEKDAARYRFIRSATSGDFGVELIFDTAKHPQLFIRGNVDMAVDAAIDAALKDCI